MRRLLDSVAANLTHGEGTVRFEIAAIYAGDQLVTAVGRDTGQARGKALDLGVALAFRIADGKVVEYWQGVDDLDAFRAFWS